MHPLPLVILLTLAADPDRTIPVGCREDFATCREDCTIDYGGSTGKYRLLSQCMERCSHEQNECTTRHYSLRDANLDSLPQREKDPAMREPSHDDDLRDSDTRPASSTAKPPDGVRRGVYRATEEEPAAQTEPAVLKEPAKMKEPEPEPEPEPAPAPKPSPAAKSKRAPASSKEEDIRIFDDPDPEPAAEPAPKAAAPKPSEPLRPKPPAEPKKKDISDWDPNGK